MTKRTEIASPLWHTRSVPSWGQIGGPESLRDRSTARSAYVKGSRAVAVLVLMVLVAGACATGSARNAQRVLPTPRPLSEPTADPSVFVPTPVPSAAPAPTTAASTSPDDPVVFSTEVDVDVYAQPGVEGEPIGLVLAGTDALPVLGPPFQDTQGRVWLLIRDNNLQGWVTRPLPALGPGRDVIDEVAQLLGSSTYQSLDDLALAVADIYASPDPPSERSVVERTEAPTSITVDVTFEGDDSLAGVRLVVIFASPTGSPLTVAEVESVIQRPLCARGVTADGLCT